MKKILLLIIISAAFQATAQSPFFTWARMDEGTGVDAGIAITTDASGNVYTTGYFSGSADFDPGAGTAYLTSSGSTDVYVLKVNAAGNFVWAKSVGGIDDDLPTDIAVDASGNVYVSGQFNGTADLDPGIGVYNVTKSAPASTAAFLVKLNSTGNFVWGKQWAGTTGTNCRLNAILINTAGNIILSGALVYSCDFDPNAGVTMLTGVYQDAFFMQLTAAGNFSWVKQITGVNSLDYSQVYDVETDPSGNIIIVGIVHGTFDFNPGAGTANITTMGFGDSFVAKYTSAGNYIWAGITGGTSATTTVWNSELAIDAAGCIYVTNHCSNGIVDFDITGTVYNVTITGTKTSIQKLNANGNLVWVKLLSTSSWSTPICVGPTGLYISNYFQGTSDFNPGAGVFNLTSTVSPFATYNKDCYLLNLDTAGNFIAAVKYGANFDDNVEDLWMDASGNIYTTGNYNGEGDFNPGAGVFTLSSHGNEEIFAQKLDASMLFIWAFGIGSETYNYIHATSEFVNTIFYGTGTYDGNLTYFDGYFGGMEIKVEHASSTGTMATKYRMGGPGNDAGTAIVTDTVNNEIYVTGTFQQIANFAPSRNEPDFFMTSAGGDDIFIAKINSSGDLVWCKRIGNANDDYPSSIFYDGNGRIYLTGYYSGTVDFNPNGGVSNLTSAGSLDCFVLKMDTAGGFSWARSIGGAGSDIGNAVTAGASGNVIVTGNYTGTIDLDPTAAPDNYTSAGNQDLFIVKINSGGTYAWGKSIGGVSNDKGLKIITDGTGKIIVAGTYGSTVDFDPGAAIQNVTAPNNLAEIFLLQLGAAGDFVWIKSAGGTGIDNVTGLTRDKTNNIYLSGTFNGTADLDPRIASVFNVTSNGGTDVFILCYNPVIDDYWVKTYGGASNDDSRGIAIDATYNVYTMGNFSSTVDFNSDAGTFNLSSRGTPDIYALKLGQTSPLPVELLSFYAYNIDNKKVQCNWATATETNNDYFTVEHSPDGKHFTEFAKVEGAGTSTESHYYFIVDLNPFKNITYYRLKQTDFDGNFSYSQIIAVKFYADKDVVIYPNPATTEAYLSVNNETNSNLEIFDAEGRLVKRVIFMNNHVIDTRTLTNGIYTVRIIYNYKIINKKLVVRH